MGRKSGGSFEGDRLHAGGVACWASVSRMKALARGVV